MGAIISSYNEVTERLKHAHERLHDEVAGLREELRLKNAELRRRERLAALGEMAAGLAHEIRNPLGGIALSASLIEKEVDGKGPARAAAVRISQGVRLLERLVSEILDFAQEYRLECRDCRLGEILGAVEDGARSWATEHGATVAIEPSAFDLAVYCDPLRMRQALLNLVINGIQAAGDGGRVWLKATAEEDANGRADGRDYSGGVLIEVMDDGPGIAGDLIDRIFNPFFTTRATGTGLGLPIVHRIVEAHGGTVSARNREEGGAVFVVRLPPGQAD